MNTFALAAALVLGQLVVDVSPDRSEAVSYVDEPLVLRVRGLTPGIHTLSATVVSDLGEEAEVALGTLRVPNDNPLYVSVPAEKLPFGPTAIAVASATGGASEATTVYRIYRPAKDDTLRVVYALDVVPGNVVDHAVEIPVGALQMNASVNIGAGLGDSAKLPVTLVAVPNEGESPGELYGRFPDAAAWAIPVGADPVFALEMAALADGRNPPPMIALAPESAEALTGYLSEAGYTVPDAIIVPEGDEAYTYRILMEQAALEFIDYHRAPGTHLDSLLRTESPLARPRLTTLGSETSLEARARLNRWSRFLVDYDAVGAYDAGDGVRAVLLRYRARSGAWLIALVAEVERAWTIPEELGAEYVYSATMNARPDVPEFITLGPDPVFLTGSGSGVLERWLSNQIQLELKTLSAVESYMEIIPGPLADELQTLMGQELIEDSRSALLGILRTLPQFETLLRDGTVAPHVVVPVIARLTRVLRLMAALAEAQGRPFLEPPATMLTQSNRFVARFMSRHPDLDRKSREGQLVRHIAGLTEEASALAESGLETEAAGVAMLALWRSRALVIYGDE